MDVEKVRVRLDIDEVWPVYSLVEPKSSSGIIIDVPEKLLKNYQVAESEFDKIQRELHLLYEEFKPKES